MDVSKALPKLVDSSLEGSLLGLRVPALVEGCLNHRISQPLDVPQVLQLAQPFAKAWMWDRITRSAIIDEAAGRGQRLHVTSVAPSDPDPSRIDP